MMRDRIGHPFADPALPGKIARELARLLSAAGIARVADLVGTIHDGREVPKGAAGEGAL